MTLPAGENLESTLIVLGCRALGGKPSPALQRRLKRARQLALDTPGLRRVIFSGKGIDAGVIEAEVMAEWWQQHATPQLVESSHGPVELLLEGRSRTTSENARQTAALIAERTQSSPAGPSLTPGKATPATQAQLAAWGTLYLVTCDFHLGRATRLFQTHGLSVVGVPATHSRSPARNLRLALRELGARLLEPWERFRQC